jgi:transposase
LELVQNSEHVSSHGNDPTFRLIASSHTFHGAIACYVGVIPRIRQSGKKRFTKGPAIPLGNARLRKSLFMVVLQLVRRNPWLRQYYERLRAAGKPGKVTIITAMRKLLTAVWSVATHRRPFVPIMPVVPTPKNA